MHPKIQESMDEYLDSLSDEELISKTKTAYEDLCNAATDERNSEWHESCFAGYFVLASEMSKRGLKVVTLH